jgi:hypothetical protein
MVLSECVANGTRPDVYPATAFSDLTLDTY